MTNYRRGADKEYRIRNKLLSDGWTIVQRSAGSHSPIDIFAIDSRIRVIKFIQSKPKNFSKKEKEKIETDLNWLNGMFRVEFELID